MSSPIERHKSIKFLQREFLARPEGLPLRGAAGRDVEAALRIPASVAFWIKNYHPELATRERLHIVVLGVEWEDGLDDGCWYELVPWLLGNESMRITTTLVGPNLFQQPFSMPRTPAGTARTVAGSLNRSLKAARLVPHQLDWYFKSKLAADTADLFFAFNPGLEEEAAWLAPGNLDTACRSGAPIGIASYCDAERVAEFEVLDVHGFRVGPAQAINPFAGALTPVGQSGSIMWEILPVAPNTDFVPDPARVARLEAFARAGTEFLEAFGRTPIHEAGTMKTLRLPGESVDRRIVRLLTPMAAVDLDSGEMIELDDDGRFVQVHPEKLPAEMLRTYPQGQLSFDQIWWAIRAFRMATDQLEEDTSKEEPGLLEMALKTASTMAQMRAAMAPPGREEAEDHRLFPFSHDEAMGHMAKFIKQATGKDVDPEEFLEEMRLHGGIHGPTNDSWLTLFSHLEWNLTEADGEPARLKPAFHVHSRTGVTMPVFCEAYGYLPGDNQDKLAEDAKRILAKNYPNGAILVFKAMPHQMVDGHRFACGGLLYMQEQWRPFALCDSMHDLDDLIEQRKSGFSFNHPDVRYADDAGMSRALNIMTHGRNPNEPCKTIGIRNGDWIVDTPA